MTSTAQNVRLNNTPTVHVPVWLVGQVIGRACNGWVDGGNRRIRVALTDDAVTCKSCIRNATRGK